MNPTVEKLIQALKLDQSGDWDGSHNIVQQIESKEAYRIHAYLHRKEGDIFNARYWYNRASEPEFRGSLDQEWNLLYQRISR